MAGLARRDPEDSWWVLLGSIGCGSVPGRFLHAPLSPVSSMAITPLGPLSSPLPLVPPHTPSSSLTRGFFLIIQGLPGGRGERGEKVQWRGRSLGCGDKGLGLLPLGELVFFPPNRVMLELRG